MASRPITSWQIDGGKLDTVTGFIFLGSKITTEGDCSFEIKRHLLLGSKAMTNLDSMLKSRNFCCLSDESPYSQSYGFSSSHVWMWELDYKESWVLKNWCFWTVVLEKGLENPFGCKEMKLVNLKGSQYWTFLRRTDAEVEAPILWPPYVKNRLIGKDPDAGKDWWQEEKGMPEDEMVGWHHWLNGHEFEQTLGVGEGLGSWEAWHAAVHGVKKSWTRLSDWTITKPGSVNIRGCRFYSLFVRQSQVFSIRQE